MLAIVNVQNYHNFKGKHGAKCDQTGRIDDENFDENIDNKYQKYDENNKNIETNGSSEI